MEDTAKPEPIAAKKPKAIELLEELLKHSKGLLKASTTHLVKNVWSKLIFLSVVLFLGLLLTSLRIAIFYLIPPVLKNVVPETYLLDVLLTYVSLESFVVSEAWHIIAEVVETVTFGAADFPTLGAAPKLKLYTFSPRQVEKAIKTFATTCAPYDSVPSIIGRSFQVYLGPVICPVLRYVYPVPWLYDALFAIVGWMSPDPTPAGFNGENNCKDDPESFAWPCAAIGVGYIVLEVLLPLILIFILVETLFVPVMRVLWTLIKIDVYIATMGIRSSLDVVKSLNVIIKEVAKDKDV